MMRRLSIKLRVTLWFTLFLVLLVAIALAFLLSAGARLAVSGSQESLIAAVADSVREMEYEDGALEIDDDLDYFQNGVYLTVSDETGRLLYGRLPAAFTLDVERAEGGVRTTSDGAWFVYDAQYAVGPRTVWVRGVTPAAGSGGAFSAMRRLALVALPFLVLLAAVGGYLLIDRAFRPVRQITAAAERIGGGKDLSERLLLPDGGDEIHTLAATFDRMFDRLEASFESERQFTADASHELRTPVSVIIAQCEDALAHAGSADEAKAALTAVLDQARRMSALIAQLLTLARADRAEEKLQLELIDLSELASLVAEQAAEQAVKKGITVETDIEPALLFRGDETMLMRMLLNLTENGVKYGKPGGKLSVRLSRSGGWITGEVSDDGIGIAPEHLPHIWERFYQADPARSAASEGTGLGLSMVKYIVEAHGGRVSAVSAPGAGSTFAFRLPTK